MARLRFDEATHMAFADLSGDRNPIHVDDLTARQSPYGHRLAYGCQIALLALDAAVAALPELQQRRPRTLAAAFQHPLVVGDEIETTAKVDGDRLVITWHGCGRQAGRLTVTLAAQGGDDADTVADAVPAVETPRSAELVTGLRGSLALSLPLAATQQMMPHALAWLGAPLLATITTISRVVGMHCPGERSVEASWTVEASDSDSPDRAGDGVEYAVTGHDERFGLVQLSLTTASTVAAVKAFVRPGPVHQPSAASLRSAVEPGEFAGERAVVVGGSRGVGEVVAKLLALGGADVVLTYERGEADARRIVDELVALGCTASAVHFDAAQELAHGDLHPTLLGYFATPAFTRGTRLESDDATECSTVLLDGLRRAVTAVTATTTRAEGAEGTQPSPIVVLTATTMPGAKAPWGDGQAAARAAAAEWLHLQAAEHPGVKPATMELPTLATDNTASVAPTEFPDPGPLVAAALRTALSAASR